MFCIDDYNEYIHYLEIYFLIVFHDDSNNSIFKSNVWGWFFISNKIEYPSILQVLSSASLESWINFFITIVYKIESHLLLQYEIQ